MISIRIFTCPVCGGKGSYDTYGTELPCGECFGTGKAGLLGLLRRAKWQDRQQKCNFDCEFVDVGSHDCCVRGCRLLGEECCEGDPCTLPVPRQCECELFIGGMCLATYPNNCPAGGPDDLCPLDCKRLMFHLDALSGQGWLRTTTLTAQEGQKGRSER